jgi:hypothetical protein
MKAPSVLVICAMLLWVRGALAEPPGFARLPYPARPLVQAGSGNLLPSPGFVDGLRGWDTWGDVGLVEMEGRRCCASGRDGARRTRGFASASRIRRAA